jgi:GlcNAc-PI de-N-acetylase
MRRSGFLLILRLLTTLSPGAEKRPRVILAVFAHPDDEAFVGPVLARYARAGVKVYLAIATKGEKGTSLVRSLQPPSDQRPSPKAGRVGDCERCI